MTEYFSGTLLEKLNIVINKINLKLPIRLSLFI
jgi:hypothetical protein